MIFLNETTTIRVSKKTAENMKTYAKNSAPKASMKPFNPLSKNNAKLILKNHSEKTITGLNHSQRRTAVKIVIDSYAWVEHFIGSQKGCKAEGILEDADEVYTPDIVLAEVARKYAREGIDKEIIEERLIQIEEASEIVCIDAELAAISAACFLEIEENAKKSRLSSPGLFDAIILATGKTLGAKILTGDQHFKGLPETIWLE